MQVSAEVRWFQVGSIPDDLKKWFCEPAPDFRHRVGGGHQRIDVYVLIQDSELGIKSRGGKKGFEVKGLVDVLPWQLDFGQMSVVPQLFCKWSSGQLEFADLPAVETVKTRWLRKFNTAAVDLREIRLGAGDFGEDPIVKSERPDVGCNVELTSVTLRPHPRKAARRELVPHAFLSLLRVLGDVPPPGRLRSSVQQGSGLFTLEPKHARRSPLSGLCARRRG
jgi:hypothetical protein